MDTLNISVQLSGTKLCWVPGAKLVPYIRAKTVIESKKKYVIRYQEQNYARSWMPGTKAV